MSWRKNVFKFAVLINLCIIIILFMCYPRVNKNYYLYNFNNKSENYPNEEITTTKKSIIIVNTTIEQTTNEANAKIMFLKNQLVKINGEQKIYNEDIYGKVTSEDLVIVVQVHNRLIYLKEVINSLRGAAQINSTLLIFSHDSYVEEINTEIRNINFAKVMQIFFPYSIEIFPDEFPGLSPNDCGPEIKYKRNLNCTNAKYVDKFSKFRNPGICQIKHHWWWKANYVFHNINCLYNHSGYVMFIEEDHYLAPDFLYVFKMMINTASETCPECKVFSIGTSNQFSKRNVDTVRIQKGMDNFGVTFNRSTWNEIVKFKELFCKYDDYNWDWTIQYLFQRIMNPTPLSMVMLSSRVCHIGLCGSHFHNDNCNPESFISQCKKTFSVMNMFPKSLKVTRLKLSVNVAMNGGWGDPRDHALCMKM